jgi:4,5-DOPA dioxygenase extradiol
MTEQTKKQAGSRAWMPAVFIGHGSPMNAIEDNAFAASWRGLGQTLPRPEAVLCISAHWETRCAQVTAMERPRTIHDFWGFPEALGQIRYPAPGCAWLADAVAASVQAERDESWGLDHGCWSVLTRMYPEADIPMAQLSLDRLRSPQEHYALGQALRALRGRGVLVIGSGNLVHNLRLLSFRGGDESFGFDWALEANALFKKLIDAGRHEELAAYRTLGDAVQRAVPTPEHFLPALYVLAVKGADEAVTYFNDAPWAGALTMTSFVVG